MASRLRDNIATYFDVFCEVQRELVDPNKISLKVLYPPEYSNENTLRSIKQFSFPAENKEDDEEAVQLFTFVLTDAQSQYTFGYCRFTPRTDTCLCILSGFSWATHFYKFLNHVSSVINNGTSEDLDSLLTNAYHVDIPDPGCKLSLDACTPIGKFIENIPDLKKLPTLREDKFMLEFYNAVSERQMIPLFASLLKERRIIFTSQKLSKLSSCVLALSKLLFPFHWQNLFIPVLPNTLTDMLMAPMPYIIGVPKQIFKKMNRNELGEVVIVDLEAKTFESPFVDILPTDALNYLRAILKSSTKMFLSDGLARAFLQTIVIIFGKYSLGFVKKENSEDMEWDRQIFVNNQRPSLQPFLNSIIGRDGVQYFERFIEERLNAINIGLPIQDEFEKEIDVMGHRKFSDNKNAHSLLQNRPPEALQYAVSNVKENANDVIGALKDKVQAISIKETFGRFTPSEVRRRKLGSTTKKKKRLDPLFVDAANYDFNNPLAAAAVVNNKSTEIIISSNNDEMTAEPTTADVEDGDSSFKSVSDAESVNSTGDLIDLSDLISTTTSTSSKLTTTTATTTTTSLSFDPKRSGWETFD